MSSADRHNRYMDAATAVAMCSSLEQRHGAVLVKGKQIIASGFNSSKTHPLLKPYYLYPNQHAEASAIIKAGLDRSRGATLYVVRVTPRGVLGCSKPCACCQALIEAAGIKRVFWSENEVGSER